MSPRAPVRFPSQLLIREIAPQESIVGFRAVRVGQIDHPELPLSFRSHYEEGLEPRYQQTQHAALHLAVSFWRGFDDALNIARRFPSHGAYIARVELSGSHGFNVLDRTAEHNPRHLTVWGQRERLAGAVVDIVPVKRA